MILKTYARIITEDAEATLAALRPLVGREPELRFAFRDMEVITLGDFCLIAGPAASTEPFRHAVGPVIVDDAEATRAALERAGAEITVPVSVVPTGLMLYSRHADGVVVEWVQWRPDVWARVNAASGSES